MELVKHPFKAQVTYPFRTANRKGASKPSVDKPEKTESPEDDPGEGPSGSGHRKKRKRESGRIYPKDSSKFRKYGQNMPKNLYASIRNFLSHDARFASNPELCNKTLTILASSLAKRTWQKYSSALALWERFADEVNGPKPVKFSKNSRILFMSWCFNNTALAANTVKAYLSALKRITLVSGSKSEKKGTVVEKLLLRGIENLRQIEPKKRASAATVPMSINILEKIQQGLERDSCNTCSKKSIWALCLSAYWGLLRLGEILPRKDDIFDSTSDLLWKDVKLEADKVEFRLKFPKVRNDLSKSITLYKVSNPLLCPVSALRALKKQQVYENLWNPEKPVFLRSSGRSLTKASFLRSLNVVLRMEPGGKDFITGKSFRSGIPSELEFFPSTFSSEVKKNLGRWKGSSFSKYIRNPDPKNRWIFKEVSEFLIKNSLRRSRKESGQKTGQGSG